MTTGTDGAATREADAESGASPPGPEAAPNTKPERKVDAETFSAVIAHILRGTSGRHGPQTYLVVAGPESGECVFAFIRAASVRDATLAARKLVVNESSETLHVQALLMPVDHYELA